MSSKQRCACCESGAGTGGETGEMTCYCPLDDVIDTVGKRYSLQIVAVLVALTVV